MAILEDIINRNKGAQSLLTNDELQEQAQTTPAVVASMPEVQTESKQDNVEAAKSESLPEVKFANKPTGLSDSEYEHLLKYNTPEQIASYTAPFDPTKENYLQRLYKSSTPQPVAPDEKKIRNAQLAASIGDGIGILSQMFSAGKGAYMKERDYKQSASSQVEGRAKELQDRYLQQSTQYSSGLFNARLKDFQKALEDYNNGRKGIQDVLAAKRKLDWDIQEAKVKQANEDRKYGLDVLKAENTAKNIDSQIAQREAYVKQGWSRVADSRNRTSAYIKKISSPGNGKGEYQMIFEASPNDKEAQTDQFGNKVRVYNMTKGEANSYARAAKADPSFFERHPHLVLSRPDMSGAGKTTYAKDDEIAAVYAKEMYEKEYKASTPNLPKTSLTPSRVNINVPGWNNGLEVMNQDQIEDPEEIEDDDEFPIL